MTITDNHPITPPPELVNMWMSEDAPWDSDSFGVLTARPSQLRHIATQAARWGADQELEACCEWIYKLMDRGLEWSMDLRASRRPEPPSLKEQALLQLDTLNADLGMHGLGCDLSQIRRALQSLPD